MIPDNRQWLTQRLGCDYVMPDTPTQRRSVYRAQLIEGVEEGGVAMYLDNAEGSDVNLFV